MKNIILGLLLLSGFSLLAQNEYNFRFQQEYFFGNAPYAKTEAMGGTDVALGGTVNSIFYNPAGLGVLGDQEVSFSTSAPFYALRRLDYFFLGYGRRINEKLVVSLSANRLAIGPTTFDVTINGVRYPVTQGVTTNLALSGAYSPVENLHIGANINMLTFRNFADVAPIPALHFDVGALYLVPITDGSRLQVGLSANNFLMSEAIFESPQGDRDEATMPFVGRAGLAYILNSNINLPGAGEGDLDFTATVAYMNVLNNEYRNTIRFGTEVVLYKALAVRAGWLTQDVDDLNNPTQNVDRINDFTYGFGIIIPLSTLTEGGLPFDAHLDFTSQKQPSFSRSGRRLPNMRTFGLRLVWPLNGDSN